MAQTHFGYQTVDEDEKARHVRGVFDSVASRYDLMNDVLSMGMHRVWKAYTVAVANVQPGMNVLDVAGGTGDIAFRIIDASGGQARATILDINGSMLAVGAERAEKRGLSGNCTFVEANAEELPFADSSFDAYTIAFGIRNVPHIDRALSEAFRVLKRSGRLLCLEFSEVQMPLLDKVYEAWSFNAIPAIGKAVTGDGEPYRYLVESIAKFPSQPEFARMISAAGFSQVTWRDYTGGIAALHSGWKL